jgi:hypothetical protein
MSPHGRSYGDKRLRIALGPLRVKVRRRRTSAPSPFVTQLRTSAHAIAKSEGQSPGVRATTDMLERYPISFPNVTS